MLSSYDIIGWFDKLKLPAPDIIRYPELDKIDPLILNGDNCKFILYEQAPKFGHWTIIFYSETNDSYIFFDSYGIKIDDELEYTYHKDMTLTEKILNDFDSDTDIDYNEKRYQSESDNCGKICCIRYLFDYLGYSISDFEQFFYHDKTLDTRDLIISTLYDAFAEI